MRSRGLLGILLAACVYAGANDTFVIRNATVHPVSGPKQENVSVLVVDGKIAEIGPKVAVKGKIKIVEGKGLQVFPGMIDSGSPVGMSEIGSVRETTDTGEIGDFNPQLRAIVAVNPESEHIPVIRANGITSAMVLPGSLGGRGGGPGSILSGQVSLLHLDGWTWEEMEIRRDAALQMVWPAIQSRGRGASDDDLPPALAARRVTFTQAKRNQEEQVKKLKEFFEEARRYQKAKASKDPALKPDLKFESMIPVLEGKRPIFVLASKEREIREAVDWATREQVKIVLANVREPGAMTAELAKKNIPVILGSPFTTPIDDDAPYDEPFALAGLLHKAGVKIAFASFGTQFARNLPYEAGQSVAFGLPYDEALKAVTLNPAQIWGVADQYGSIEPGKWADLIVTDGDPLEVKTNIKMMFIKGAPVDLESKHTRLYKKYLARP
ncbi:amidohydrolase family protein [uncultured Paludibaculum sp.]|uniref:amidohydrolase family protein n=1 Tax=uncultured Paludibaculum sp. TaxID=1765020 RepID=UPI002AAA9C57|nr:amidohydrolase family protein [uncultured Paludibaculum sp.]